MASNTSLRKQRMEMGLSEHGSDLLFGWFLGHQGPYSLPGPRMIAVEDADVEQVLETDVKRRDEITYDFVGDVVRATDFPCVNFPEYVSHFAEPDSVRMDIWVKGYDLLEV